MNKKTIITALILGIVFFTYTALLTYNLPFFWEDLLFLEGSSQQSYTDLAKQTIRLGTENISHPGIPLTTMMMKVITTISGINPIWLRILRSFIYGTTMIFVFLFLKQFNIPTTRALLITSVTGFSYPFFLTNFFIPRPEITGIALKYAGLSVFFSILFNKKTLRPASFYLLSLCAGLLFFTALKFVSPLYIIAPTLFFFMLFWDYKKIPPFLPLLTLLFLIYFPTNITTLLNGNIGTYHAGTENMMTMLNLDRSFDFFSFKNLYYQTILQILTPAGIFVIAAIIFTGLIHVSTRPSSKKFKKNNYALKEKAFILFNSIDLVFSFAIMSATPDPATRYYVFFIIPLLSLIIFPGLKSPDIIKQEKIRTTLKVVITFCLFVMILHNIALSALYRFTWGGAFIGMDKTSQYMDHLPGNKVAFYYSESAAEDYSPIKVLQGKFVKKTNTAFIRKQIYSVDDPDIKKEYDKGKNSYLIKRTSASGHSEYPPLNFDSHPDFNKETTIIGADNILDTTFLNIVRTLKKTQTCATNKFQIYKYHPHNV